ncbi:MAG: LLM class flavin-dependent oxidoreductase [bacterium]|nr:LLM class flavin-dependent oxidoreductase [bacterium]
MIKFMKRGSRKKDESSGSHSRPPPGQPAGQGEGVKFYVALQGNKPPAEYIRLGRCIEELGFDRVYVYDDLMYRPSWPILTLIAANTERIELGPCLVNGFYRHPAIIAENAVFLDEVSGGRAVLGMGRGAFFDFLELDHSEETTRNGCEEAIQLVKRFFAKSDEPFKGEFFKATEKAVLRWDPPRKDIPIVLGSWNEKMAYMAGKHCRELQTAECWETGCIETLYRQLEKGAHEAGLPRCPDFSIGGICCISNDEEKARRNAKQTLAVYLPYLKGIMEKSGIDTDSENIEKIDHYSKRGRFEEAVPFITDPLVDSLSLTGTPALAVERLTGLLAHTDIKGIMFSPPYGTGGSIEDSLQLIARRVIPKIRKRSKGS